ncbi:MAG: endopeptidase La [Alphaproteobacteria bacterium]|nr:endopeptidase La [Alphaproteobacteria bacterium]
MTDKPIDGIYPVLALRDIVIFPNVIVPLFVGRDKSIAALKNAMEQKKQILLITQMDEQMDSPHTGDLFRVGILANVLQLLPLPDGTIKILIEGVTRARVMDWTQNDPFFEAHAVSLPQKEEDDTKIDALMRSVFEQFEKYAQLSGAVTHDIVASVSNVKEPAKFANIVITHIATKMEEKQKILELDSLADRLSAIFDLMEKEIEVFNVERNIRKRVKKQMEKSQREYYLNEQMKAIQKELGDSADDAGELGELEKKIKDAKMSKEATEKALTELKRLRIMGGMSAEAGVIRNYIEWLIALPWSAQKELQLDLKKAEQILDEDHYGLKKVKERILEFLAVQKRTGHVKGSILCLVGPPGVGKTSLGQSIARATGRTFVRASLGGMHDEAEIRGHRRTYIGSMPGKIIQSMKKAGNINPLFLLDEIDKVGNDYRGDPASALLEVLDPEQNKTFSDHYLDVDYDLSNVMFICTANDVSHMPSPLLDRMEIIRLSGYTEDEKVEIAKRHLIPRQLELTGLKKEELTFDDASILEMIRSYTMEAGVRQLEREIAKIARKVVKEIQTKSIKNVQITPKNVKKYAGVPHHFFGIADKEDEIGVSNGLYYSEIGGGILPHEVLTMPGTGKIMLTGKLGDVFKETVEAARSYVRAHADDFGISDDKLNKQDIHLHVPEGAQPKDGPSSGVAIVTALVSALTGIPVKKQMAMTGEITLRGRVLAIGGLKEKLLGALRAGIKTVFIPTENKNDLEELPDNVKRDLKIIFVSKIEEVLNQVLTRPLSKKK